MRHLRRLTPRGTLGHRFWLIVLASTCASLANGAVTPLLPLFVRNVLHGDAIAAGVLVGLAPFIGVLGQPLIGWFADRHGYKPTWILSSLIGIAGLLAMLGATTFGVTFASRALFGIATSASATLMAAWVIASLVPQERGRGLGLFGVSVWIGLGAGPQLGQLVLEWAGYAGLWLLAAFLTAASLLAVLPVAGPEGTGPELTGPEGAGPEGAEPEIIDAVPDRTPIGARRRVWTASARSVLVPGIVAGLAWSAEGVILAFLIVHLDRQGFDVTGITAPASVLTIFAVSVIVARFLISSVTDRIGPRRTAGFSLVLLAVALVALAFAGTFAVAAVAAVLLGFAFAPLYPALTLLANEHLTVRNRGTGLGIFSALTAVGTTFGTLYGGLLSNWSGEWAAFVAAAGLQVVALAVLARGRRPRRRPVRTPQPQRPVPAPPAR